MQIFFISFWARMWTSGLETLSAKETSPHIKACTGSHMCNPWQCSNLWGSSLGAPALLPQGLRGDWKTGLSHKMKWSLRLCAPASTGGSPHCTPLGVRYTLERHAGIIRDLRLLKKLRNSHELHCGRWINRPSLESWVDLLCEKGFSVCLEPPFNCLWMSFSWFGFRMFLVFQMLMLSYTDGKSNFKVHILCRKLQLTSKIRIFLKIGWCLHACFVS